MKKLQFSFFSMTMAMAMLFTACTESDTLPNPGNDTPGNEDKQQILFEDGKQLGNGNQEFEILSGDHTIKKGVYLMKGWIYVGNGATLTIEPGTVIKGDKETKAALIVEPGGKIIAQGTKEEPIVFTSGQSKGSRKPGDWGGLIICGRAKNNKTAMMIEGGPRTIHGGSDDNDNSGVLSYVRVEFAGYPFKTDQEINGITFGSVGRGTKIDHVQVSYSNDDSFEWFGGSANAKYLVAYHGWDDDFDTDNGFSGNVQFALGVRNPRIADTSVSNGFESDNNADGTTTIPTTSAVFSNVTFVGPIGQDASFINTSAYINAGNWNPNNGSKLGQFQSAMQLRRSTNLNCFNTAAIGYPVGLIIENDKGSKTQDSAAVGKIALRNIFFAGMGVLGSDKNKSFVDQYSSNASDLDGSRESFSSEFFRTAGYGNESYPLISDLKLANPNSLAANANYGPQSGSPLTGKANLFTDPKVSTTFFEKVTFIGAFQSDSEADNWTSGWCNFDPNNTEY